MQSLQSYNDMDISEDGDHHDVPTVSSDNQMQTDDNAPSLTNLNTPQNENLETPFRTNSLLLVTFPWFTPINMVSTSLSEQFPRPTDTGFVRRFIQYVYRQNHNTVQILLPR